MAIFDEKTGERLDGPDGKLAREGKKPEPAPAKDSEPKPEEKKPAKSPKKG